MKEIKEEPGLDENKFDDSRTDKSEEERERVPLTIGKQPQPTQTEQGSFAEFLLIEDENQKTRIQLGSNNLLVSELCSYALWLKENVLQNKSKKKKKEPPEYIK